MTYKISKNKKTITIGDMVFEIESGNPETFHLGRAKADPRSPPLILKPIGSAYGWVCLSYFPKQCGVLVWSGVAFVNRTLALHKAIANFGTFLGYSQILVTTYEQDVKAFCCNDPSLKKEWKIVN